MEYLLPIYPRKGLFLYHFPKEWRKSWLTYFWMPISCYKELLKPNYLLAPHLK